MKVICIDNDGVSELILNQEYEVVKIMDSLDFKPMYKIKTNKNSGEYFQYRFITKKYTHDKKFNNKIDEFLNE